MKKKVIYQITRHKISKIEITSEEEERAVAEANRDFERIDKRDKRYRLRNSSLEAMSEQVGFDIADKTPSPEESLIKSEGKAELRAQVRSALSCLTEKQREVIVWYFWEELSLREIAKKGSTSLICGRNFYGCHEKIRKIFQKVVKIPRHTPQKTPYISEGQKADKEAKH